MFKLAARVKMTKTHYYYYYPIAVAMIVIADKSLVLFFPGSEKNRERGEGVIVQVERSAVQ